MKHLLFLATLLSFSALAQDQAAIVSDFKTMLPKYGISPRLEQTFCYNQNGTVEGYQVDKLQRIASVTKLFTTLAASETLDLNKRFETKIYISGDKLHISGSRDPYFEEEKLLLLMQELNDLGYVSFKSVTFDKNFIFSDVAQSSHQEITPAHTRLRLATYMNKANIKFVRSKWLVAYEFGNEEGVHLEKSTTPMIHATTVAFSEGNPLAALSPSVYTHKSKPLHAILKSMNVMSKNIVAQNVFLEAGRVKKFETLMTEKGIDKNSYVINNGSGLPIKGAKRYDNWASCRTVIKVIELLSQSIQKHKLELSEIVAINGGEDLGSFRERFLNQPETHEAVISKTGTVVKTSTLAGVLLINGQVPFAILNHPTTSTANARKFQDSFVARLFHHLGEPTPMDYSKISIFPWDGTSAFLELSY